MLNLKLLKVKLKGKISFCTYILGIENWSDKAINKVNNAELSSVQCNFMSKHTIVFCKMSENFNHRGKEITQNASLVTLPQNDWIDLRELVLPISIHNLKRLEQFVIHCVINLSRPLTRH